MSPDDTTLRVTAEGVGENALEWCQLVVVAEEELREAETKTLLLKEVKEEEEEDRTEEDAWAVVMSLMDGGGENIRRQRETRAKRVLRRLCEDTLSGYPDWAHKLAEDDKGEIPGVAATGAAAAGIVLASEIRALKGALRNLG